jgi:CBS domain-containing protein
MPDLATDFLDPPLAALSLRAPVACAPEESVGQALRRMRDLGIGSMIVTGPDRVPLGILTLRDVLDRVSLETGALQAPISRFMTPNPITLPHDAGAYAAALAMIRHSVRHIVLVDGGRLAGVVSERDLFGLHSTGVRHLSEAIRRAEDLTAIEQFGRDIGELARKLLAQGVAAGPLSAFIASLNDLLTQRIVELEFRPVEVRYCWILMGSEGRSEQTLLTDQDNGIIFEADGRREVEAVRAALVPLAQRVNRALDRAGYRLCPGNIMAGNPQWTLSLEEWRDRFARWIESGGPDALLHGAVFFDLRGLHGDLGLARELRRWLARHAPRNARFLHQMAANALRNRPPLGLLRRFATDRDGRINLKLNAATPFVDAARIFALACGVEEVNTERRLRGAAPALNIPAREAEAWIAAYHHIQGLRLRRQAHCLQQGREADNRVAPYDLHEFDQRTLHGALRQARAIQARLAADYRLWG